MDRREFVKHAAAVSAFAWSCSPQVARRDGASRTVRRVRPGDKGLAGAPDHAISAARDTAMNPAVLDAFALAIVAGGGPAAFPDIADREPDLAAARREARRIDIAMDELLKVAPEAGSYVSESDYFEENWQRSFWGSNYKRLAAVKRKYDPDGLFFVHHGVGSEEWSADGFTRVAAAAG